MRFVATLLLLTACAGHAPPRAVAPTPVAPKPAAKVKKAVPKQFGLTGAQIRPVLSDLDGKISGCYAMEYGGQHNEGGKLTLEWVVNPSGTSENVHIDQSTFNNPTFERCVLDAAKVLRFPETNGQTAIRKPYELNRRTASAAPPRPDQPVHR